MNLHHSHWLFDQLLAPAAYATDRLAYPAPSDQDSGVHDGHILIILGVAVVTLSAVALLHRRGIPVAVVLVVAGLIIGFLPFVPDASLPPDVVLLGLLPILVYDAAVTSSPTAFFRNARSIGVLAVLLVVVTAFAVAAVVHWLGHVPWALAFILGTAVGPTDAAAATSIARRLGLPRRLVTIIEGEALFNDATALVLYGAAVAAATTGHFSIGRTAWSIVYSTAAGAALGLVVGFVGQRLRALIDDPPIEIAASILLAYVAYLPAEALHASGVLAAVVAGLYLGWHASGTSFSAHSRLQSNAFWETLVFLVNAALFVLVGLSFHTFTSAARGPVGRLALTGAVVVLTVIVVRLAWIVAFGWLLGLRRRRRPAAPAAPWRERAILGWSGMRGAITLAALLAVPEVTDAGHPLVGRDDIIYLGFAVIVVTLLVQGLTLPALIRRFRLREHPTVIDAERQGRLELARATLHHLNEEHSTGRAASEVADVLAAQYAARVRWLETTGDDESDLGEDVAATAAAERILRRDLIAFQRQTLSELRRQGRIGVTTMRTIEHDLDLEEARLSAP
jgi:CPA1 family monovalent cation:H+ antiporter